MSRRGSVYDVEFVSAETIGRSDSGRGATKYKVTWREDGTEAAANTRGYVTGMLRDVERGDEGTVADFATEATRLFETYAKI